MSCETYMMTLMISMALMFSVTLVVSIMLLVMRFFEDLLVLGTQIFLLLMPAMVLTLVLAMMLSLMGVFLSRCDFVSMQTLSTHSRACLTGGIVR